MTIRILSLLIFTSLSAMSGSLDLEARGPDKINLYADERLLFDVGFDFWDAHWSWLRPLEPRADFATDLRQVRWKTHVEIPFSTNYSLTLPSQLSLRQIDDTTISFDQTLDFTQTVKAIGGALRLRLPTPVWYGQELLASADRGKHRFRLSLIRDKALFSSTVRDVQLVHAEYGNIRLMFNHPVKVDVLLRNDHYEMRIWVVQDLIYEGLHSLEVTMEFSSELSALLDPQLPGRNNQTADWVVNPLPWDDFPIDLSFLNHRPAGKHGFVRTDGEAFKFQNGDEIRFWGVNLSAMQCFPDYEEAQILARRLAKIGVNLVRIHHLNVNWSPTKLCSLDPRGRYVFDEELWNKLDYLLCCLKKEGIYIQMDLLVDPDEIWPRPKQLRTWKGLSYVVPELVERQRRYAALLWGHVNPYTEIAYKDDPSFAMTTLVNENDITSHFIPSRSNGFDLEPYISEFEKQHADWAWKRWKFASSVDLWSSADGKRFLNEIQEDFFADMRRLLKSQGVSIPINGTNWILHQKDLPSQATMDFMDTHVYRRGRLDSPGALPTIASEVAFSKIAGLPLTVSEYGTIWPDQWRVTIPLQMAAHGSQQGWNALSIYAYRQSGTGPAEDLRGAYNLYNDPVTMGIFPAAALLFRRGDIPKHSDRYELIWSEHEMYGPQVWRNGEIPFFNTGIEMFELASRIDMEEEKLGELSASHDFAGFEDVRGPSGGAVQRDVNKSLLILNSPHSSGVSGKLRAKETYRCGGLKIKSLSSTIGAIHVSSLDSLPLENSNLLLISAIGRGENSNDIWNYGGDELLQKGQAPVVAEVLTGTIFLPRTDKRSGRLISMSLSGPAKRKTVRHRAGFVEIDLETEAKGLFYILEFGDTSYLEQIHRESL
ncbi:MAG: hypothetical protein ACRBF0_07560 [Calditrichia bacterium]